MSALRHRYGCRRRPIDQPTLVDSRCEPDNVRLNQREGVCVCVYSTQAYLVLIGVFMLCIGKVFILLKLRAGAHMEGTGSD